jgi:hypothetical protein
VLIPNVIGYVRLVCRQMPPCFACTCTCLHACSCVCLYACMHVCTRAIDDDCKKTLLCQCRGIVYRLMRLRISLPTCMRHAGAHRLSRLHCGGAARVDMLSRGVVLAGPVRWSPGAPAESDQLVGRNPGCHLRQHGPVVTPTLCCPVPLLHLPHAHLLKARTHAHTHTKRKRTHAHTHTHSRTHAEQ